MGEQAGCQKLDPKVMDVLLALARNAGKVVLREDLLARLWANAVVTDESLSRCIYELRRQLSLAGGDERYKAMFETVPKRGYRLNAQLTPIAAEPPAAEPPARRSQERRRWHLVALIGAIAVAASVFRPQAASMTRGPRSTRRENSTRISAPSSISQSPASSSCSSSTNRRVR